MSVICNYYKIWKYHFFQTKEELEARVKSPLIRVWTQGTDISTYICTEGVAFKIDSDSTDSIIIMIMTFYYTFQYSYPKIHDQTLGFIQEHLLKLGAGRAEDYRWLTKFCDLAENMCSMWCLNILFHSRNDCHIVKQFWIFECRPIFACDTSLMFCRAILNNLFSYYKG